jgi:hypothetical protein
MTKPASPLTNTPARAPSAMAPVAVLLVAAELVLALLVLTRFQLDPSRQVGRGLWLLVPLFLVHAFLPVRLRMPLLLAATVALLVGTTSISAAALIVAVGLGLIGCCHLPIAYRWRLVLILCIASLLWLYQARVLEPSRHLVIALPILGALFMFRLVVYLYDIRHEKPGSATVCQRLGYFFLLPAPVFLFFPALDYRVYLRCYYSRPAFAISQTGMLWISRGITHLVLYRFIYHFYSPPAEEVTDLGGVMAYCLSGYLIYLRVSGLFHLIGGILRLFGFDLPDTHRLYFFASGFSDYWRRINIYWKDFMAKIFFFPTFSKLRKLGTATRIAVATAVVFAGTTVLHAYQTFWLRGRFEIHETDYWFWGILGVLVIINNLMDDRKRGVRRVPGKAKSWSTLAAVILSARVTGMFLFLCVLWALWSSQELSVWFGVMAQAAHVELAHLAILGAFCGACLVLGTLGQYIHHRGFHIFEEHPKTARSIATTVLPLLLLAGLWQYHMKHGLPGTFGEKFEVIRIDQPNQRDEIQKERSYYEDLLAHKRDADDVQSDALVKMEHPADIRASLYTPSLRPMIAWNATWSTNRWGMRDKYYARTKPGGVYRIALSGASYTVGRSVPQDANFESLLEEHLNEAPGAPRVEILNFAMADTSTVQNMADLELRMTAFSPDAFYLVCHGNESGRNLRKLASLVHDGHELTYDWLKELAVKAGVKKGDDESAVIRALQPYSDDLMEWTYRRMAAFCKEQNITPVWIFLPLVRTHNLLSEAEEGQRFASAAGFHTIILDKPYGGLDPEIIKVSESDYHPNALGHRFVAQRLLEKMKLGRTTLGLPAKIDAVPPITVDAE